ncbi:MAG: hypothetical protein IKD36_03110 [Clostridia bacterium]|nr:hypothetical protein [Clostridia bacterium]
MKKIVKFKEKQLEKINFPGNFLYTYKEKFHFADSFCNAVIINSEPSDENEPNNIAFNVEKYFLNYLKACKFAQNPPAILTVNGYTRAEDIEEILGDKYEYLSSDDDISKHHDKTFYMNITAEKFEPVMDALFEARRDIFPLPNNIVMFIFNPEDDKLPGIDKITTVSRSRSIYTTTYIEDKQKFEKLYMPEILDIVEANCKIIFKSNQNEILSIEARPYGAKPKTYEYKKD